MSQTTTKFLADVGARYLHKGIDGILESMSLQRRPTGGSRALTALGFFGLGVGAGVAGYVAAKAFAPQIAEGAKQMKKVAADVAPQIASAVGIDTPSTKENHTDEPAIRRREPGRTQSPS